MGTVSIRISGLPRVGAILVVTLGFLAALLSADADDAWMEAPFQGTVTITRHMDGSKPMDDGITLTRSENAMLRAVVHGCREQLDEDGQVLGYRPRGEVTVNARGSWTLSGADFRAQLKASGSHTERFSGEPEDFSGMPTLRINPVKGLYSIGLPAGSAIGTLIQVSEIFDPPHRETESTEWRVSVGLNADDTIEDHTRNRRYSVKSGTISDSFTITRRASGYVTGPGAGLEDGPLEGVPGLQDPLAMTATYTVQWSLTLGAGPKARAVIEPLEEYDTWIPTNDEDRSQLGVIVRIVEPPGAAGRVTLRLDSSRQPGECLNFPSPAEADDKPDLVFASEQPDDLNISEDRQSATTPDAVNELLAVVASKDWGGYGTLVAQVRVVTPQGVEEVDAVYEPTGEPMLAIPKDDDRNGVADHWQKQHDCMDRAATCDEDESPATSLPGDGLGLYEEYRGVHIGGRHTRLDPNVIDLFLRDESGLVASCGATAAFGPLRAHFLEAAEMNMGASGDERKRVNFNTPRGDKFVTDQHGLHVVRGTLDVMPEPGEEARPPFAQAIPDGRHARPGACGPPIETDVIVVDVTRVRERLAEFFVNNLDAFEKALGRRFDNAMADRCIEKTVAYVVTHEVGHGVGIDHHKPEESGSKACPMRIPDTDHDGYSLLAVAVGRAEWGMRYCPRCVSLISVSDARRYR